MKLILNILLAISTYGLCYILAAPTANTSLARGQLIGRVTSEPEPTLDSLPTTSNFEARGDEKFTSDVKGRCK